MNKINYFDERELLVKREIETKTPKGTEAKGTQVLPKVGRVLCKVVNNNSHITDMA